jgi:hypothetical protein
MAEATSDLEQRLEEHAIASCAGDLEQRAAARPDTPYHVAAQDTAFERVYGTMKHGAQHAYTSARNWVVRHPVLIESALTVANVGISMLVIEYINHAPTFFSRAPMVKLGESALFIPFVARYLKPRIDAAPSLADAQRQCIYANFSFGTAAFACYTFIAGAPLLPALVSAYGFAALGSLTTSMWAKQLRERKGFSEQLADAGRIVVGKSAEVGKLLVQKGVDAGRMLVNGGAKTAGLVYGSGMFVYIAVEQGIVSGYRSLVGSFSRTRGAYRDERLPFE